MQVFKLFLFLFLNKKVKNKFDKSLVIKEFIKKKYHEELLTQIFLWKDFANYDNVWNISPP